MSDPTASTRSQQPIDPKIGLMLSAANHLIPLLHTITPDPRLARDMALSAIAAYAPETRADYVNTARTIAFSMASLALLGRAAAPEVTLPEQLRAYGRANTLNRPADQSERTMMQRRRYQKANPPAELPAWMDPGQDARARPPEAPIDDDDIRAAVAETMREYLTRGKPAPSAGPKPATDLGAAPAAGAVQSPSVPQGSAIHYNAAAPHTAVSPKASFKAALMQNSAMPNTAERRPAPTSA
jgi:hypothetical protein